VVIAQGFFVRGRTGSEKEGQRLRRVGLYGGRGVRLLLLVRNGQGRGKESLHGEMATNPLER